MAYQNFSKYSSKLYAILILLLFQYNVSLSESLSYTVMKGDDKIGTINISRTVKNNVTEYFFESKVKLRFIISVSVYDRMKVTFKGTQMWQAELYRTLNGKVKVDNIATWNGKNYDMKNKDNKKTTISHAIYLTTANLYYNEPINNKSVFSENFQKMIPIKNTGSKKYTLELPNGNKTTYSYANGICNMVEADTDWATLNFVLNK